MQKLILILILFFSSASNADNKINYPERAENLRIGGEVSLLYDINGKGRTENIRFISAEPNKVFNRSVRSQMRFWQYPAGKPQKDVSLRIIFKQN